MTAFNIAAGREALAIMADRGSITSDAFLPDVDKPDRSPLVPLVSEPFRCLQQNGNDCLGRGRQPLP